MKKYLMILISTIIITINTVSAEIKKEYKKDRNTNYSDIVMEIIYQSEKNKQTIKSMKLINGKVVVILDNENYVDSPYISFDMNEELVKKLDQEKESMMNNKNK